MQDFAAIRAFKALCEHQSLTSAARALDQPKSTLSRRIAQLEEDLSQRLTIRQGNRLQITKAGEVFYQYCERILSLHDEGMNVIQHLNNDIIGELTIVAHTNLLRGWLSGIIDQFLKDHPKLNIRLISQYQADGVEQHPDLILWIGELDQVAMKKELLGYWHGAVYASPDYLKRSKPITHPKDLNFHPWIHYQSEGKIATSILSHEQHGDYQIEINSSRLHCDNMTLQLDAIAHGRGIGVLPVGMFKNYSRIHPNQLTECLPGWFMKPLMINCYTPYGHSPYRTQAFLQKVREKRPNLWLTDKITKPS